MNLTDEEKKVIKDMQEKNKEVDFCIECEINPEFAKELSEMLGIDFKENEAIINTNILLNLIKKQQKEIKTLQKIITKDLPTNQEYINTFCGIPIVEVMDMIEICKNKTIHLNDKEYKNVIELSQKDYISKEAIREILNKYAHTEIGDMKIIYFYRELKELLGE